MKRVAFFAYGIGDISGGGGYERFFTDFLTDYSNDKERHYDLVLITDNAESFRNGSELKEMDFKTLQYTDYRFKFYYDLTDKIFLIKGLFKFFRTVYTQFAFLKLLRKNKIDILHLPNYTKSYFFLISFISKMRFINRIKTAITVVDCRIPFRFNSNEDYYINSGATGHTFKSLFNEVKLDGIFTWYKSFKDFVVKNKLVPDSTKIYPVKSRYVNFKQKVIPFSEKKNFMIFAGRLDDQKRPLLFLNAVKLAIQREPKLLLNWKFKIFGKGILESPIRNYMAEHNLQSQVELSFSPDMKQILNESKCLVSTQEFENFPSLSIYEAMVTGNAIIAFNVGQTSDFIKKGVNGLLAESETAEDFASSIITYVTKPETHKLYYENNLKLCSQDHTYLNFRTQIEEFWNSL